MSRIGKKTIEIPKNVFVEIQEEKIIVKGKHGVLERFFSEGIYVEIKEDKLFVLRKNDSKNVRSCHGLMRALIQNMIQGVNENFSKNGMRHISSTHEEQKKVLQNFCQKEKLEVSSEIFAS